jgi:hypothetical protein
VLFTVEEQEQMVELWHRRLGHQGVRVMQLANSQFHLGMGEKSIRHLPSCVICRKSKATRKVITSLGDPQYLPEDVMLIWFADLAGPVNILQGKTRKACPTYDGKLYVLTLVEAKSHTVVVVLLRSKSEAADAIILVFTQLMNRTQRNILRFGSDGGGEFKSIKLLDWFAANGIQVTTSTPDHPQHNGRPERYNRTLFGLARTFLIQANAPYEFWGRAIEWAAFVYNCTPHPISQDQPPFTILFNSKFHLRKLKIWGCDIEVKKLPDALTKIQPQSYSGMFLGYDGTTSSYLVLARTSESEDYRLITSRDVAFYEDSFKFMNQYRTKFYKDNGDDHQFITPYVDQVEGDDMKDESYTDSQSVSMNGRKMDSVPDTVSDTSQPTIDEPMIEHKQNESITGPITHPENGSELISEPEVNPGVATSMAPHHKLSDSTSTVSRANPTRSTRTGRVIAQTKRSLMDDPRNYDPYDMLSAGVTSFVNVELLNEDHLVEDELSLIGFRNCHPDCQYTFAAVSQPDAGPAIEPTSYSQAMASADKAEWRAAMQDEINSLKKLNVWSLAPCPSGTKPLTGRWVFKNKLGDQNQLIRRKARFVVKGFLQMYGRDFTETHAPVAKMKSILMQLSLTASNDYELQQLDFDTAFLNAPVKEEIYMEQPEGFHEGKPGDKLKLIKALYGLKQAPHEWNETINAFMKGLGWVPTVSDSCVYVKSALSTRFMLLCLYVDDTVVSFHRDDQAEWLKDKAAIADRFAIKDLGECTWILNMKVTRDRRLKRIHLSQQAYVEKMCTTFLSGDIGRRLKPIIYDVNGPNPNEDLTPLTGDRSELYRQIVGSLLYAANVTRIDITHSVSQLCRYTAKSNEYHLHVALCLLSYLQEHKELGLEFGRSASSYRIPDLKVYTDADWAGDPTDRKSTSGVVVLFNGDIVKWVSKRQKCVALSTLEAEYIALADGTKEAKWCQSWINEVLGHQVTASMLCDNKSALCLTEVDAVHDRSKHIDIRYHFVRDEVNKKNIIVKWVSTKAQLGDILTKRLDKGLHGNFRSILMKKAIQ